MIGGIRLTVERHLCQPKFVRWRRTHRQKRIAKKRRKKYGAVYACPGVAYQVAGMGIVVCPCAAAVIRRAVP